MPINIRYYRGTNSDSRAAVSAAVDDFLKKNWKGEPEFIRNYTIHVVDNYEDLSANTIFTRHMKNNAESYKYTGGASLIPELNANQREIIIKTEELAVPRKWFHDSKSKEYLEHAVYHEIGHMFDNYYGKKDPDLLSKMTQIGSTTALDKYSPEQDKLCDKFYKNKDLSDSDEFKQAWKSDLENYYRESGFLNKGSIKNYFSAFGIDITDGLSNEEIEKADLIRSEDFAQLFGYAFGKDDGDRDSLIQKLPRTFNLIKSYIEKYLGLFFH